MRTLSKTERHRVVLSGTEFTELSFTQFYLVNSEKPIGTEFTELSQLGTEQCLWVSVKYWGLIHDVSLTAKFFSPLAFSTALQALGCSVSKETGIQSTTTLIVYNCNLFVLINDPIRNPQSLQISCFCKI